MAEGWRYLLAESATMSVLGELQGAKSRTLSIDTNKSGNAGFTFPMTLELVKLIRPWKTCLIVQHDDEWYWSGPISTRIADYTSGRVTVSAIGWFELVLRRLLNYVAAVPGYGVLSYPRVYTAQDAAAIAFDLLNITNAVWPTYVVPGMSVPSQPRTRSYVRDINIGQEIQALAELEAGYDWEVDPVTREFNIVERRGVDRPDCKWLYVAGQEGNNLSNAQEVEDGMTVVNDIRPRGRSTSGFADDPFSRAEYGLHQEAPSLSDVVDENILNAYANGEIVYRSNPRKTYALTPQSNAKTVVPRLFHDFNIGDTTYATLKKGYEHVDDQAARVFGADLSIHDSGKYETISRLQTSIG